LLFGCSKEASQEAQATDSTQKGEAHAKAPGPGVAVFAPPSGSFGDLKKLPTETQVAFSEAAAVSEPFAKAPSWEREAILKVALPAISRLADANKRTQQTDGVEDASVLARLDYRFGSLNLLPEFASILPLPQVLAEEKSKRTLKVSVPDPGGLPEMEAPSASGDTPLKTTRPGPDRVIETGQRAGQAIAEASRAMHLEGALARELETLLRDVLAAGEKWTNTVALKSSDPLQTRTAKVAMSAAFGDLLGKIVARNGSYFLGVKRPGGPLELWEFKQPITLGIERKEPDASTRLNTGIQLIATVHFNPDYQGTYRRYANGFFGTWKEFPKLESIKITKAESWIVETQSERPRFFRPSSQELETILARSDTTGIIGRSEAALDSSDADPGRSVFEAYGALGETDALRKHTKKALEGSPEAAVVRQAISGLVNLLCLENPRVASDFLQAKLFTYYKGYKSLPENAEMIKLPVPAWRSAKHPYGENPGSKAVETLKEAFRKLLEAEPENRDAHFDLALLDMLTGPTNYPEAVESLTEAIKPGGEASSKRDFARVIANTPTFLPLSVQQGAVDSAFIRLLGLCRSSEDSYRAKVGDAALYFSLGY
jgi:tetratricopeptide (TPR) repeat protein